MSHQDNGVSTGVKRPDPARTSGGPTLDIRAIPSTARHTILFGRLRSLGRGEALLLVDDEDPKPLYFRFESERVSTYTWEYLEQGPDVWRVRIGHVDPGRA